MDLRGTYYRWTRQVARRDGDPGAIVADILGLDTAITANQKAGTVSAAVPDRPMSPDEARMIGVRLIEAAALADDGRSIRQP